MTSFPAVAGEPTLAHRLQLAGRAIALIGVLAPLMLIGGMKFTAVEIAAIEGITTATPWLAWLPATLGGAGASYFLGIVELLTAALLIAGLWSVRAAVAGASLASLTFLITCSLMLAQPIWEPSLGFPALGPIGQFLIKDIALLGIALVALGEALARRAR